MSELSTCSCWHEEWDRWNTRDTAKCGQHPAERKPDPSICPCRCHELEYDHLFSTRRKLELIREVADLTIKIHNLEETYEPVPFGGGPTTCRCDSPKLYCRTCKGKREDGQAV